MNELRIGVFGCKHTTVFIINALRQFANVDAVITISPDTAVKADVADYCDLSLVCSEFNIPCYSAAQYSLKNPQDQNVIADMQLDIGFVIGWQRLIPSGVFKTFSIGVFGMHGSADDLPVGRGRSPMNWALIERRSHFHTNLFRYNEDIDSGDILDSIVFSIQPTDNAETMHYKNVLAMKYLIQRNIEDLKNGIVKVHPQKNIKPTFYPKRNPEDSIIDFRQDIFQIETHIRAVTKPFNGAFTFCNDEKVIIYRAAIFETDIVDLGHLDKLPGEVVEVFPNGKFLIRCKGGLLFVDDYETKADITVSLQLKSPPHLIKQFPKNPRGYHDMEKD